MIDPVVILNDTSIIISEDYAHQVLPSILEIRKNRGQVNKAKILEDEVLGKQVEFAVETILLELGLNPSEPDISIHKNKVHGTDLFCDAGKVSVKGYRKFSPGSPSWVFEKNYIDKINKIDNNKHYLAMGLWQPGEVEILGIIRFDLLFEFNLFKPMRLKHLTSKTAIYWDDIEKIIKKHPHEQWAVVKELK